MLREVERILLRGICVWGRQRGPCCENLSGGGSKGSSCGDLGGTAEEMIMLRWSM